MALVSAEVKWRTGIGDLQLCTYGAAKDGVVPVALLLTYVGIRNAARLWAT